MGTNYYLVKSVCNHCGRGDEPLHIGKSSAGWCFSLHVTDEIKSLDAWKPLLQEHRIVDEYGDILEYDMLMEKICNRSWNRPEGVPHGYVSIQQFELQNHCQEGPNGLWRHRNDGMRCIGHGEGTWDLISGEFS